MIRKGNKYELCDDYVIGHLSNGKVFKIDLEDYERIKDLTCYPNGAQVSIRSNGKQYQLARFIMMHYKENIAKCFFRSEDKYDFRKANLYTGNDFVLRDGYYEVFDLHNHSFLIDIDDRTLVEPHWWNVDANGYVICARGNDGKAMKLHRYLLSIVQDPGLEIDHINHDTTDNRRENLRIASRSENCLNRRLMHLNSSGAIGVYKHTDYSDKWCAQINFNGKREYLGIYDCFDDAVCARKQAELKYNIMC